MRIGEVAAKTGISSSAIRFYERHGLLSRGGITRSENGYRYYTSDDLEEIRLIVKFKKFGLELNEIKNLLGSESRSCGDLVTRLDKQLDKCREMELLIRRRIVALSAARDSCKARCKPSREVRKCCG